MAVTDWNTDPNANTTVGGINIAENCPAGNINGALREMMAEIKVYSDGLGDDYQAKNNLLSNFAALTGVANALPIFTGTQSFSLVTATPFIVSLLDDPDAATACQTLGAIRVTGLSLNNPGYIRLQVGSSSSLQLAWGTFTAAANGYTGINYATPFPNVSFPVVSGAAIGPGAQDNNPETVGNSGTANGFQAYSAADGPVACYYVAVGF